MYSLKQIKDSIPISKKKIDSLDIWVKYVIRPASFYVTWICLKMRMSANTASIISMIISVFGALLIVNNGNYYITLVGVLIMNFWIVFDCVDGNIARTKGTADKFGKFLDALSGYLFLIALYTSLGISVSQTSTNFIFFNNLNLYVAIMGIFTVVLCLFPRLVQFKATELFGKGEDLSNKTNYNRFKIIGLNIAGVAGLANPLLFVFTLFKSLNLYVVLYFCIQLFICVYSILSTFKESKDR